MSVRNALYSLARLLGDYQAVKRGQVGKRIARRAAGRVTGGGLDDGQVRTLEEVGKEFGVTRERIRQIESKTLAKLRHPTRSQRLRDYLEEP